MQLTTEEEGWVDGRAGEATRFALSLVVRMGENILLELIRTRRAPVAIVSQTIEPVLAVGPFVGEALYGRTIPMVALDAESFAWIRPGDWLVVDGGSGEVGRREP